MATFLLSPGNQLSENNINHFHPLRAAAEMRNLRAAADKSESDATAPFRGSGSSTISRAAQGSFFARLLITNTAAGLIIGKNGQTINSLRDRTGCMVRVSPPVFLGNEINGSSRIVSLSGTKVQVNNVILSFLATLRDAPVHPSGDAGFGHEIRFLVPNSTVSVVIGKGGARVNEIRQQTGAQVQISRREGIVQKGGCIIRTIVIQGEAKNLDAASLMIVEIIQEDPALREFMNWSLGTIAPGNGGNNNNYSGNNAAGGSLVGGYGGGPTGEYNGNNMGEILVHQQQKQLYISDLGSFPSRQQQQAPFGGRLTDRRLNVDASVFDEFYEIYIQIPNSSVGSIVGKNGQNLAQIRRASSAKVSISQKGELVPGTEDRLVTISGTLRCIHLAHILIMSRLHELPEQGGSGGGGGGPPRP